MRTRNQITEGGRSVNSYFRSGTVALAGRSNVGKSTLLNRMLGSRIAIETSKPQATRFRVLGIRTRPDAQLVWVDLPGIHAARNVLNRRMVDVARRSIGEADVTVLVIDARAGLVAEDLHVAELASAAGRPWLLCVNKIDLCTRAQLLHRIAAVHEAFPERDVVPVSARTGENVDRLEDAVARFLPLGPALFPEDEITDQTERQIVEERIREKIFECTGEEVPYHTAVVIDSFTEKPKKDLIVVQATILVERESQRRILIGRGGAMIREIGKRARRDLEEFFGKRLFLDLHVKVKAGWTKNPRLLDELGL